MRLDPRFERGQPGFTREPSGFRLVAFLGPELQGGPFQPAPHDFACGEEDAQRQGDDYRDFQRVVEPDEQNFARLEIPGGRERRNREQTANRRDYEHDSDYDQPVEWRAEPRENRRRHLWQDDHAYRT